MSRIPPQQQRQRLLDRVQACAEQTPGESCLVIADDLSSNETRQSALAAKLSRVLKDALDDETDIVVVTCLSNADEAFNPFAGLAVCDDARNCPGELVEWLGSGRLHAAEQWPWHLCLLSAGAVDFLGRNANTSSDLLRLIESADGKVWVCDALFLHAPAQDLFASRKREPHEDWRPASWGDLVERISRWTTALNDGLIDEPAELAPVKAELPRTLHVTHSWGGGVAQWIESFIGNDQTAVHLQLRAESPDSDGGCGQHLSLYLGNQLGIPLQSWWLRPAIADSDGENADYRLILREICARYGIGRVIISSLLGHALDCFDTGLPTIQVMHDFYPIWPLLGENPTPYVRDNDQVDLAGALEHHELMPALSKRSADSWLQLATQWRRKVQQQGIKAAAPSRSVADLLRKLDPAWESIDFDIIPHGLPAIPGDRNPQPRAREDGRLNLIIPGRIQSGKGRDLLLQALPKLTPHVRLCLLGAGKDAEAFFGKSGVDVILNYDRECLRDVLSNRGPHLAALLSVVPETFSYTLSEMQQLNIPVIATRVGALAERVEDGETGWLIEPNAESLVECVRKLCAAPEEIERVRSNLEHLEMPGPRRMIERYRTLCQHRPVEPQLARPGSITELQSAAWAQLAAEQELTIRQHQVAIKEQAHEIEKRTEWAEERERARADEERRRIEWVDRLQQQISDLEQKIEDGKHALNREKQDHKATREQLGELRSIHEWVLATRSWRFTKPFRAIGRMMKNLGQVGAWNPLRWPMLLSRSFSSLRSRGLKGTLSRAQVNAQHTAAKSSAGVEISEQVGNPTPPAEFVRPDRPRASIIIPVYNKWEYTAACLRSLAETHAVASYEVIVVDDQSSDETWDRLQQIKGLVALRNEENLGFVGSCNRGAESAAGEYLVMLNNDTQVTEGWLDALLETFRAFPDTGMAGARLVYPDGRLQEAGGIIFSDGSGWNYGKFDDPDRPDYNFVRETDYCSGACVAIEKKLFEKLGGFDTVYAPAYYEDTDLAFKVRDQGLKVRVQSGATIIHHEGITSGTDLSSGAKRHQLINQKTFLKRWHQQLAEQPAPINNPNDPAEIRRARDHDLQGRILVIDAYTPEPDQDSGSVRLCYLMECLMKLGYRVSFMPDNRAHAGRYTTALQQAGIETLHEPWLGGLVKFFSEQGETFDYVFISRHYVTDKYLSLLRKHCPSARLIFDTVDLHYLREERLAELENSLALKRTAAQTRRAELAVINAADATLVVSPVEKEVLAEAAPSAQVNIISNIHEVTGSQTPFNERKDIFFVGGYQHPPNIDAACWFVSSIWPLIHEQLPDIKFHLIGSKAPDRVRALDGNGVVFHGFVESLDPWLDGCRIAVAPLRYGAGVKGKVNMSMSRGQPVVATPMAVEGMFAKPGHDVLVAEDEQAFANDVVRLYQDEELWNRISRSGLENVEKYFSVETARLGLRELLQSLRRKPA